MDEISLRRFNEDDAQAVAQICNDGDVQRYLLLSVLPYGIDDARKFLEYARKSELDGGEQCYAILLDGRVIGCISYAIQGGCHSNSASIGYYIGRQYWNRGYMPRAIKLILDKIFSNNVIDRVFAEIFAENIPSARVLEKCGFVREGYLRNGIIKNGIVSDAVLYSFVR